MVHIRNRHKGGVPNGPKEEKDSKSASEKSSSSMAQRLLIGAFTACMIAIAALQAIRMAPIWMVNWPSSLPRLVTPEMMEDHQLLWGTYRPHTYFGVKARVPLSPAFGLAWFNQYSAQFPPSLRHWASQDDKLRRYGWVQHDGREFGHQELVDSNVALNTTFVKFCHTPEHYCDWTARITAQPINTPTHVPTLYSLVFYVAIDPGNFDAQFHPEVVKNELVGLDVNNVANLGSFSVTFESKGASVATTYSIGGVNSFEHISDYILSTLNPKPLGVRQHQRFFQLETIVPRDGSRPNLVFYQLTFDGPVMLDVAFFNRSSHGKAPGDKMENHMGEQLTHVIQQKSNAFKARFEAIFDLASGSKHATQFQVAERDSAAAAFSNLLGGVGYFYGYSLVNHPDYRGEPVLYGPNGLYTAVPSRSFFPRGFLWDEGFHTYVLSFWDVDIVLQIVSHWLDLLNRDGWIPREQILDAEARKRVPHEFIVQRSNNANPPAMFLTLNRLISMADPNTHQGQRIVAFFERAWPRLTLWVDWYLLTQTGDPKKPFTFRWRGRDANNVYELNSKTLTSGLDDYPRASHPTDEEIHVDLRCWMGFVAKSMSDIAKLIPRDVAAKDAQRFSQLAVKLYDNSLLNGAHWFADLQRYADVGLHSSQVKLQRQNVEKRQPDGRVQIHQEVKRMVLKQPVFGAVGDAEGYVSLFPLMMRMLEPSSEQLGLILKNLNETSRMWTSFGLRSLSQSSAYYRKRNTEHDPPYWRGQIWMNLNYLVLGALKHYSALEQSPHRQLAAELYEKLRQNLVGNVLKQYSRTGYFWEQYDDQDGHGMGSHPFTGWTATVVLMMAEKY